MPQGLLSGALAGSLPSRPKGCVREKSDCGEAPEGESRGLFFYPNRTVILFVPRRISFLVSPRIKSRNTPRAS